MKTIILMTSALILTGCQWTETVSNYPTLKFVSSEVLNRTDICAEIIVENNVYTQKTGQKVPYGDSNCLGKLKNPLVGDFGPITYRTYPFYPIDSVYKQGDLTIPEGTAFGGKVKLVIRHLPWEQEDAYAEQGYSRSSYTLARLRLTQYYDPTEYGPLEWNSNDEHHPKWRSFSSLLDGMTELECGVRYYAKLVNEYEICN